VNGLIKPLNELAGFVSLKDAINKKKTPVMAAGVMDSQKAHLAAGLSEAMGAPVLFVAASELKAKEVFSDLRFFYKNKALLFPSKDIIFYGADVRSAEILKRRFETLGALLSGEKYAVCCSVEALFDRLSPAGAFKNAILKIETGQNLPIDKLAERLVFIGYERADAVEGAGQFALRGGILDVCAPIDNAA